MIYLDLDDLLYVARRTLKSVEIRDLGLLAAAVARPQASAFGDDAYPTYQLKTAALIDSIAKGHPLVDGNKRLALAGAIAFLGLNDRRLTLTNDEAYNLIVAVADGSLDEVAVIAGMLVLG